MGDTHNLPRAMAKRRYLWGPLKRNPFFIDSPDSIKPFDKDLMLRSNQIDVGLKSTRNSNRSNCVLLSGILLRIETASPLVIISNNARIFIIVSDFGRIRGLFSVPNRGGSSHVAILVLDITCKIPCIRTLKYSNVIIASIRSGFSRKRVEASRGILSTLKLCSTLC